MAPGIVPDKEVFETKPTSIRLPVDVSKAVNAIAKRTGQDRSKAIVYLLRWAVAEDEKKRDAEAAAKK
jgi:metal-responsive CopG/Arc/MetJ family transcriptional regulator